MRRACCSTATPRRWSRWRPTAEVISVEQRIRNRRDHAFAARLSRDAVEAVFASVGGAGLALEPADPAHVARRERHLAPHQPELGRGLFDGGAVPARPRAQGPVLIEGVGDVLLGSHHGRCRRHGRCAPAAAGARRLPDGGVPRDDDDARWQARGHDDQLLRFGVAGSAADPVEHPRRRPQRRRVPGGALVQPQRADRRAARAGLAFRASRPRTSSSAMPRPSRSAPTDAPGSSTAWRPSNARPTRATRRATTRSSSAGWTASRGPRRRPCSFIRGRWDRCGSSRRRWRSPDERRVGAAPARQRAGLRPTKPARRG